MIFPMDDIRQRGWTRMTLLGWGMVQDVVQRAISGILGQLHTSYIFLLFSHCIVLVFPCIGRIGMCP